MTSFENRLKYDDDKMKALFHKNEFIESMKKAFVDKFFVEYYCCASKRVAFANRCYSDEMSLNAYAKLDIDWNMFIEMIAYEKKKHMMSIVTTLDPAFVNKYADAMIAKFEQFITDLKNCGDKSRMKYYGLIVCE
jgi:hypothetical protein